MVTHGDDLMDNFIVRLNKFLACKTYQFQPERFVFDATGTEFGNCTKFRKQMVV